MAQPDIAASVVSATEANSESPELAARRRSTIAASQFAPNGVSRRRISPIASPASGAGRSKKAPARSFHIVRIEACAGDRELVFEKPGDAAAVVDAVRDTLSGPVADRQNTLEGGDREG